MAVKMRLDVVAEDIRVLLRDAVSPEARSRRLAEEARRALRRGQDVNRAALGRVPPHDTYVDAKPEAPLDSVRPDGRIEFEFRLLEDVFRWVGEQLVIHSPVLTGRFQRSHVFLADGVEVEPGAPVPAAVEYVFVNTQPYARKIERGLSQQAPDGVYEVVAELASRRFGNIARIRFGYRAPLFGDIDDWARTTRMQTERRRDREEWLRRQPAIIIRGY